MTRKWVPALVPYDEITYDIDWRGSVLMGPDTGEDDQTKLYTALLELDWLGAPIRYAVMRKLRRSVQEEKRNREHARALMMKDMIEERKKSLRKKNGQRLRGGVDEAATADIAAKQGKTVTALRRHLSRHRKG
jgi:hypothetical protein